jgi:hypothetical protein
VSANNRRRHGRVRCDGITCDLGDVIDVSASGLQVAVGRIQIPLGTDLTLTLDGPDGPIQVRVIVLRCEKVGRGFELGLKFHSLSREAARGLATIARIGATKTEKYKD